MDSNNHTVWMRTQQLNRHHIAWKHSKAINQSQTASKQQQTLKRLIWKDLRDRYRQQTREGRKSQTLWSTLSTQERLLFQLCCFNVCLCITADLKWFNTHSHLPVAWSTLILCSRCLVVVSFSIPTIGWRQRKAFSNRNKMKAWI